MTNWYEIPGALDDFESNPSYFEALAADNETITGTDSTGINKLRGRFTRDGSSWVRNRKYKKKLIRRFLTIKPFMNYSTFEGMRCEHSAIYIEMDDTTKERPYRFNPYTRVYLSRRGDIRKYQGTLYHGRDIFCLESRNRVLLRTTRKRIRQHALDEECAGRYSFYKKLYGTDYIEKNW